VPDGPKTRWRRPRAADVTGDRSRLVGAPDDRTPPSERTGPLPSRAVDLMDAETRERLAADETARHQLTIRQLPPGRSGRYTARCRCGRWSVQWPTVTRQRAARRQWQAHVDREVTRRLQDALGQIYHTKRRRRGLT
jgi:hypothetical protein